MYPIIEIIEELERFVSKKIEKKYKIIKYLGRYFYTMGKDAYQLKIQYWKLEDIKDKLKMLDCLID